MSERPSSSHAGEMKQAGARVSVKDRLGPLPPQSSAKRRGGSADRSRRRGRKQSKSSAQGPDADLQGGDSKGRISVYERLGPLPPQAFKKNDLFQKKNRQQVWRHQGYYEQQAPGNKEPEVKQRSTPVVADVEHVENVSKFGKPAPGPGPAPAPVLPVAPQPFNAEQHRQAWTWVRPTTTMTTNSSAMEVDEST